MSASQAEPPLLLFDVEKPPVADGQGGEKPAAVVKCSECGYRLRSERSRAAGVSQACAAKVGVAVLTTMRESKRSRRPSKAA